MRSVLGKVFWAFVACVSVSGFLYFGIKYLFPAPAEGFSIVNHPWQQPVLKIHILVSGIFVGILGMVFSAHAFVRYRDGARRGRASGIFLMALCLVMVLSGFLIQIFTSDAMLKGSMWTHNTSSFLFVSLIFAHRFVTRRT